MVLSKSYYMYACVSPVCVSLSLSHQHASGADIALLLIETLDHSATHPDQKIIGGCQCVQVQVVPQMSACLLNCGVGWYD